MSSEVQSQWYVIDAIKLPAFLKQNYTREILVKRDLLNAIENAVTLR